MGLSPWSILQFQDDETGDCLLTRPIQFGLDSTAHQKNLFLMAASCAFICNLREVFPDILDWWWSLLGQSALTGESMPATKKPGDEVFSGSTCKQGEIEAVVIATGVHTFFGKAAHLVDSTNNVGHFQKVLSLSGCYFFSYHFSSLFSLFSICLLSLSWICKHSHQTFMGFCRSLRQLGISA
jgi:hypothetical protein